MAKKNNVPKRLAGVKLPKPLRRGLRDLAASQNGRTVLVEALAAAAAAIAAAEAQPGSKTRQFAAKQAPKVKAAAGDLRGKALGARASSAAAFEEAARSFTEALRRRRPDEPPTPAAPQPPGSTAAH